MLKKILSNNEIPRWVIQLIDLTLSVCSFILAYFLNKRFEFPAIMRGHFFMYTGCYAIVTFIVFYAVRMHKGLIRFSNFYDMLRIFVAVALVTVLYSVLVQVILVNSFNIHSIDIVLTLVFNFFICCTSLVMLRTGVKGLFYYIRGISSGTGDRAIIFGSDMNAVLLKQAFHNSPTPQLTIVGFLETNGFRRNTSIQQIKVYDIKNLETLKVKQNLNTMIMMSEQLQKSEAQLVIEKCLELGIKVLTVPPSEQWISGQLSMRQVQQLKITDLLQREPIVINNTGISSELSGKTILITGAAGSIGSEIVRQVLTYAPERVILCDQAESALHEIQLEMEEKHPDVQIVTFICDIRSKNRMLHPFRQYNPQIVFHAAAYKHVPMMENHPEEAIYTNVMGTKNMVDLSLTYMVEKFVMISTDKAVNPTNIMGASKRIAEMYVQSMNTAQESDVNGALLQQGKTKFITTRFGNVLDSNGSVIPRFRSQIQKGGPLTVTHKDITRYFMTIPEAVQLVLEAATTGEGGEIFVFDMGQPVRIYDLAVNMIKLAGRIPDKDVKINITGLRPGEKLYEELLNEAETTRPTHHEKIKRANVIANDYNKVWRDVQELISICGEENLPTMVKKMKEMVPEFISNNSRFQEYDKPKAIAVLEVEPVEQP